MRTLKMTAVTLALLGFLAAGCEQSGPGQTGSPGGTTSAPAGGAGGAAGRTGAPADTAATPGGGAGQAPAQPGQSPR